MGCRAIDRDAVDRVLACCWRSNVDINRNQYFMAGLLVLFLGVQFRMIDSYVLTEKATHFLAQRQGTKSQATTTQLSQLFPAAGPPDSQSRATARLDRLGPDLDRFGADSAQSVDEKTGRLTRGPGSAERRRSRSAKCPRQVGEWSYLFPNRPRATQVRSARLGRSLTLRHIPGRTASCQRFA